MSNRKEILILKILSLMTLFLVMSSCVYEKGQITVSRKLLKKSQLAMTISNIQIINHQIVVTGTNLNRVTELNVSEGATVTTLAIESKTATSLVANSLSNVTFAAGKILNFVFSNAEAAATFTVNFSLCDSELNGIGFNCSVTPTDKQVLSYDASTNKWKPRSISGLSYQGVFDATSSPPVSGGASAAGEYYIISGAGNGYAVGDWAVDNGTTMEKIDNSTLVTSVFGRTGMVVGAEGDYSLNLLSDVNTAGQTSGQFLKYNGTAWVPAAVTYTETDPLVSSFAKSTLPTCSTGEVLKSNGTSLSCVTDATGGGAFTGTANRAVVTNSSGALAVSAISDTVLGYLSGVTSSIQTQLDSKASSASVVDWSTYSATGPYIHSTRVYGGTAQASKTLVTDVSGNIVTSSVTAAEQGYLAGVTSSIQTQLTALGAGSWSESSGSVYRSTGNVGVGTSSPRGKLDVQGGAFVQNPQVSNATTTINFATGNIQYTNSSCGAFQLNNLHDGGEYTFIVKGATSATCSFTAYSDAGVTALTVHLPPDLAATTASKHTIFNLIVGGSDVYFAWTPGY